MKAAFSAVHAQCAIALLMALAWPSSVLAATDSRTSLTQQERQRPKPVIATVQGRVFDATSHAPIGAAAVEWSREGQEHVGATDANGMFSFEIPISERRRDKGQEHREAGDIVLCATASRFRGEQRRLPIHAGTTSRVDIGLEPRPASEIGAIQGTVTDANNGKPIANATVSILDATTHLETTADPNGDYRIGGVGYDRSLRLRITTRDPPCFANVEKRIALDKPVLHLNVAATPLKLPVVHCPLNMAGPASGGPANLAADPSIHWHQADVLAIQMDVNADAWNAGHVNDIIGFEPGGGILVATDTGGVWAITDTAQAFAVSDAWASTSMFALALGPDGLSGLS